jgi:hypothetical protein
VQRIKAEAKTAGGIYLPESSVKELNEAKVLAVGPGGLDKDGKRVSCSVNVGDKVLIPQVGLWFCFVFTEVEIWHGALVVKQEKVDANYVIFERSEMKL